MTANFSFNRSTSFGGLPAAKAAPRRAQGPAQNANVAGLVKHVNESDKYSFNSVHKAFGAAMGKVKAKA